MNALLREWDGPFGLPPFAAVDDSDFAPAFDAALTEARAEIDAIAADPAEPSFANTIAAMERAGRRLDRVASVFFNLAGADTNDAREALQRDISPRLAAHHSQTIMNAALFDRVGALMARRGA
ncbi:MAG: peptidase M3, partial [Rhodobacteraceae bacterium]|nr:peptidase M3 [Paracoccaceae bacterium]